MMDFGQAVSVLKQGRSISRSGWNGKNMQVYLRYETGFEPHLVLLNAQGKHQPGWLPSQSDMLADDWSMVLL